MWDWQYRNNINEDTYTDLDPAGMMAFSLYLIIKSALEKHTSFHFPAWPV